MQKKRILLVDDEPAITRNIKLNLETTGRYEVEAENVPGRALATAMQFRPDLILLDVMMPGIDGGDVAAQIRSTPSLQHVPIIFLTAIVSRKETGGHESTVGTMSYLAKPVPWIELKKCIEGHIGT
jgi:CheY-like chemotaxis protein